MTSEMTDTVVQEIHQIRAEISVRFAGSITAIAEDAARRQAASNRPIWKPVMLDKALQRTLPRR